MRLPTVNQLKMQEKNLSQQYDLINQLRIQATTGKKLVSSSEDPILSNHIKYIKNNLSEIKNFEYNHVIAEKITDEKSEIASQSLELLRNVKQISLQAQNQTLNPGDRKILANQLEGILKQLLSYSNTRDENGNYIFGGINSGQPPFIYKDNNYLYQGSMENLKINLSLDTTINYYESGYDLFCDIANSNDFKATNFYTNTGTGIISDCHVINKNLAAPDAYTLSFSLNNQGELVYFINGLENGQVVPTPPSTIPDEAPVYKAGENINCNGINFIITGLPNSGDDFSIKPATDQNIFTTIQQFIDILNKPINSESEKTNLSQQLININSALEEAYGHFQNYESMIGNVGTEIALQKQILENNIFDNTQLSSQLSDADILQVLSNLTQQITSAQLTQEIYSKLQESFSSLLATLHKGF